VVKTLNKPEIKDLHKNIIEILKFAIEKRGTSFRDYRDLEGKTGNMVKYLKVYGRAGQKCKRCGYIIEKIRLNGRGTQYCSHCQK
jgi:formamidopyrimidine-DNA glycosylase